MRCEKFQAGGGIARGKANPVEKTAGGRAGHHIECRGIVLGECLNADAALKQARNTGQLCESAQPLQPWRDPLRSMPGIFEEGERGAKLVGGSRRERAAERELEIEGAGDV